MRCDERYMSRSGWGRCAADAVTKVTTPAGRTLHLCGTHARSWRKTTTQTLAGTRADTP